MVAALLLVLSLFLGGCAVCSSSGPPSLEVVVSTATAPWPGYTLNYPPDETLTGISDLSSLDALIDMFGAVGSYETGQPEVGAVTTMSVTGGNISSIEISGNLTAMVTGGDTAINVGLDLLVDGVYTPFYDLSVYSGPSTTFPFDTTLSVAPGVPFSIVISWSQLSLLNVPASMSFSFSDISIVSSMSDSARRRVLSGLRPL